MSKYKPNLIKQLFHAVRRRTAAFWFDTMQPYTIAVTGSQGKTSVTYLLSQLFPEAVATDINLDTIFNVPITALKLKKHRELAIFELGIDKIGEMNKHLEIVKPHIAIITGISAVHSDKEHLGSIENIIKEKRKLIEALTPDDHAILNYDDPQVREMAKHTKAKVRYYGTDKTLMLEHYYSDADPYDPNTFKLTAAGIEFSISHGRGLFKIVSPLLGIHQVSNIMAVFCAYTIIMKEKYNQKPLPEVISRFTDKVKLIQPLPGRMSFKKGPQELLILDDSLRANINSMKSGLLTFDQIQDIKGKRIAILGEMGEIGTNEIDLHREIGRFTAKLKNIDYFLGIGLLQRTAQEAAFKNGVRESKYYWAPDVIIAVSILKRLISPGDTLYLKASLLKHLERMILMLDGKEVGCSVLSCPLYNHCSKCKYLRTGYPNQ